MGWTNVPFHSTCGMDGKFKRTVLEGKEKFGAQGFSLFLSYWCDKKIGLVSVIVHVVQKGSCIGRFLFSCMNGVDKCSFLGPTADRARIEAQYAVLVWWIIKKGFLSCMSLLGKREYGCIKSLEVGSVVGTGSRIKLLEEVLFLHLLQSVRCLWSHWVAHLSCQECCVDLYLKTSH